MGGKPNDGLTSKNRHEPKSIEPLFVEAFLHSHHRAPRQIVLDLDATDDPLHGQPPTAAPDHPDSPN